MWKSPSMDIYFQDQIKYFDTDHVKHAQPQLCRYLTKITTSIALKTSLISKSYHKTKITPERKVILPSNIP